MRRRVIFAIIFCLTLGIGCAVAENATILTGREYFDTARSLIGQAKVSIDAAIYIVSVAPAPDDNPASILLEDLISAQKRGVSVWVILDDSKFSVNYNAYKRLRQAGVNVLFDSSRAVLHGKAMVIDARVCLVGSFNWSRASLYDNYEYAALIDDPRAAARLLSDFAKISIGSQPPIDPPSTPGVPLPAVLLTSAPKPPLSNLFTSRSEKAFDLYLYLVKKAGAQSSPEIRIDYPEFGRALGCTSNFYFNVFQPLRKLSGRYKLLRHAPWSKTLELNETAGTENIFIPREYWDYGFDRVSSVTVKVASRRRETGFRTLDQVILLLHQ